MSRDPEFETWVNEARDADIREVAQRIAPGLKKAGHDWHAACPVCGGRDKNEFVVTPGKRVFLCRKSGEAGDVIAMMRHAKGLEFIEACEAILGTSPPRSDRQAEAQPLDEGALKERRDERRDADAMRETAEEARRRKVRERCLSILAEARPIVGTQAEGYLKLRGIFAPRELMADMFWHPGLDYRGYADEESREETPLGVFPAMVVPFRDVAGEIIGLHRTYLHPRDPVKLKPPGYVSGKKGNRAKKMFGQKVGGLLRLGPIRPVMAIGEGIETVLSWYQLGVGPDEVGVAAAGDLGNLSGSATGSIPHPSLRQRTIPNGTPDMDKPGMIVPAEVTDLLLLGDGDSDAAATRAVILTAARRQHAEGRAVSVHFAPSGADWNDVLTGKWKADAA